MDVPQKESNKSLNEKSICTQEQLYYVEICNRPSWNLENSICESTVISDYQSSVNESRDLQIILW